MSNRKSDYRARHPLNRRPKSSQGGGRKSKTWQSLCDVFVGGRDVSARSNFPWYKAPLYVTARLKKWNKE